MQYIASCKAASTFVRNEFRHILLVVMMIDFYACLGFRYLRIFFSTIFFLFVSNIFSNNWLFLIIITKEMLVKCEIPSIFDRKLTRHHQRLKSL